MDKEEIKDYMKRADELGNKLTGKDKETYAWLIYGYNQCAKLLNETEKKCKKQKELIDKAIEILDNYQNNLYSKSAREFLDDDIERTITILKEVSE